MRPKYVVIGDSMLNGIHKKYASLLYNYIRWETWSWDTPFRPKCGYEFLRIGNCKKKNHSSLLFCNNYSEMYKSQIW